MAFSVYELTDNPNERAMPIFLQRIVGAFVGAAYSAADYHRTKQSEARAIYANLNNDDRGANLGFEGRAERAAGLGLQTVGLFAAAQGAAHAYASVTGDEWKACEPPTTGTVRSRATAVPMAVLQD